MAINKKQFSIFLAVLMFLTQFTHANRASTPNAPITHCYHWLNERTNKYLTYKYSYAASNNGELTFHTTPSTTNGSVAGPGLYCAKTPIESYSYGDRVVRVDFVDDVVLLDGNNQKRCGTNGKYYADQKECDSKPIDVHLFSTSSNWYVIKNPQAVKSWSSNSDELVSELIAIKADGNSSAGAHMDATVQLIQLEQQKIAKTKYYNNNSRISVEKILKDPALIAKIPVLTLIGMIASSKKFIEDNKNDIDGIYKTHFTRALKDATLSFEDFDNLLSQNPSLKNFFSDLIKSISVEAVIGHNPAVLLSSIIKYDIKVSKPMAERLWKLSLTSISSFESLAKMIHKGNAAEMSTYFFAALPEKSKFLASFKDINFVPMVQLFNKFATAKNADLTSDYLKQLIEKYLMVSLNNGIDAIKNNLDNAHINKKEIYKSIVFAAQKTDFKMFDPIATGLLIDEISDDLTQDQKDDFAKAILALPLRVNNQLTYLVMENYRNNVFKLPSFYDEDEFFINIFDRSISERSLGANTTNTYRLILSNFYNLFAKQFRDLKTDAEKAKFMQKREQFFLKLTQHIIDSGNMTYAYIALQNASFYSSNLNTKIHPMETYINRYDSTSKDSFDLNVVNAITTSLDPSLLYYMVNKIEKEKAPNSKLYLSLIEKTLDYLISDKFKSYLGSEDFKVANEEKKLWANISFGRKSHSDICSYLTAIHNQNNFLTTNFSSEMNKIKTITQAIRASHCK